jgi:hypothetical protein
MKMKRLQYKVVCQEGLLDKPLEDVVPLATDPPPGGEFPRKGDHLVDESETTRET